jgi:hypothetical protein
MMDIRTATMSGIGVGALVMYLFDPARGRTRRAFVRDKLLRTSRVSRMTAGKTARDARNRLFGTFAELRSRLAGSANSPDDVLEARIHSRLGLLVRHPRSLARSTWRCGRDGSVCPVPSLPMRRTVS